MNLFEKSNEIKSITDSVRELIINKGYNEEFKIYVESEFFKDSYDISSEPVDVYVVYKEAKPSQEIIEMLDSMYTYYSIRVIDETRFVNNYGNHCTLV